MHTTVVDTGVRHLAVESTIHSVILHSSSMHCPTPVKVFLALHEARHLIEALELAIENINNLREADFQQRHPIQNVE